MFVYLFWERERECVQVGEGRARGKERIPRRLCTEPNVGLEFMKREIMTWDEIKSWTVSCLSHQGTPVDVDIFNAQCPTHLFKNFIYLSIYLSIYLKSLLCQEERLQDEQWYLNKEAKPPLSKTLFQVRSPRKLPLFPRALLRTKHWHCLHASTSIKKFIILFFPKSIYFLILLFKIYIQIS